VFLEGTEEVEGVRDKRPLSNQIEHLVVDEVVELVKDVNPISLKATPVEDVERDESTTNSSLEEEFVSSQDKGLNEPQQDGPRERPQTQRKEWPRDWWVATKEVERATMAFSKEPQTMEEANGEDAKKWEIAMQEEYNSLLVNNTWSLVLLPKGRKPISCKWVFKIKHGVDGEVQRYKVRLVARGFTQTFGVDYNETFAPVAKFVSIRCILALAAIEDMEIHQMDVETAFLNGDLKGFANEGRTFSKVRNERSWRFAFFPWHESGKGSCKTSSLHQEDVEDYDVDVRNIDNGMVDSRNNVVDKCCKQSKT
jgi:hypothetical protein